MGCDCIWIDAKDARQAKRRAAIIRRFNNLTRQLDKLILDARQEWPEAQLYLASSTLNLMSGDHHERMTNHNAHARPDRIIASHILQCTDGGDW
jgi:hypothetical protein